MISTTQPEGRETATAFHRAVGKGPRLNLCDACLQVRAGRPVHVRHAGRDVKAHLCDPCFSRRLVDDDRGIVQRAAAQAARRTAAAPAAPPAPARGWREQIAALRRQMPAPLRPVRRQTTPAPYFPPAHRRTV